MLFTLEALQADFGDSLLLHSGTAADPLLVVIDGGPTPVYKKSLKPRLEQLRAQRAPDGELPIELVMLSHIDGDHIGGLLKMTAELVEKQEVEGAPYAVTTLWHNSFDDITGNESDDFAEIAREALTEPAPDGQEKARTAGLAVVASVAQGRALRDDAAALHWNVNDPFGKLVIAPEEGQAVAPIGDAMTFTVVCPHVEQLKALHKDWEKHLEAQAENEPDAGKTAAKVAAYADKSVNNLASIVVLAEAGGKSILLCGDARGDHVLDGLELAGRLEKDAGTLQLDVLKLPHHGSINNAEQDFFTRLPAKHYVISANGHDGNPETETLDMIVKANPETDDFTIHLTNDKGSGKDGSNLNERVTEFRERWKAAGRELKIVVRDPAALGLSIHLGDEQP
jgi:hypothetical protein